MPNFMYCSRAIAFCAVLFFCTACIAELRQDPSMNLQAIEATEFATINDFVTTYNENRAKANDEYQGKWVKLRGTAGGIRDTGFSGHAAYTITLSDNTGQTTESIVCIFNGDKKADVLSLKRGDVVAVFGQIDKASFGLPSLSNCSILK